MQEAALLLGATYDPAAISDFGALGLAPDPDVARAWYKRATGLRIDRSSPSHRATDAARRNDGRRQRRLNN